jgi:hypothetical protein
MAGCGGRGEAQFLAALLLSTSRLSSATVGKTPPEKAGVQENLRREQTLGFEGAHRAETPCGSPAGHLRPVATSFRLRSPLLGVSLGAETPGWPPAQHNPEVASFPHQTLVQQPIL